MKAVDTNILVRYITQDDPKQTPLATALLDEACFVSNTVLLETAWVLSSIYAFDRPLLATTLQDLLQLPMLSVAEPALLDWAIARFADGADLADMIHIAASRHADSFASFDKRLARLAGPTTPVPVETLG